MSKVLTFLSGSRISADSADATELIFSKGKNPSASSVKSVEIRDPDKLPTSYPAQRPEPRQLLLRP